MQGGRNSVSNLSEVCVFLLFLNLDKKGNYFYTSTMDLRTVLTTDTVDLHLKGTTKEEIIDEMLDILVKAAKLQIKRLHVNVCLIVNARCQPV